MPTDIDMVAARDTSQEPQAHIWGEFMFVPLKNAWKHLYMHKEWMTRSTHKITYFHHFPMESSSGNGYTH